MQKYSWMCLVVLLMGCVMLPEKTVTPPVEPVKSTAKELTNINRVSLRMTKDEVKSLMGSSVTIGFEKNSVLTDFFPVTIVNPQRTETLKVHGKTYEVEYYFTHIKQPDGIISDDELTPLIFENNRLVGQGWTFLKTIKP